MKRKLSTDRFHQECYKIAHPRAKTKLQQDIIRCFARDFTATETAKIIRRDIRTINPFYRWLRGIIAQHYQEFLRFREHDMDYDLMLLLSHTAMMTMYWFNTDHAVVWDTHTVLLTGEAEQQNKTTAELMRHTLDDVQRRADYHRHVERNHIFLSDTFIRYRMTRLRTPMLHNKAHASETLYRFMVTAHVLRHCGVAGELLTDIKGRHIGTEGNLQKAGVLHIDRLFEKYFIHAHAEMKAHIIFSDLLDWLHHHPDA